MVKINIAEVLRRELARPRWTREHVAMGTNTDPYQRAEGRYRLMPPVISALADSGTPFSILTKGTLLSRDLPLLAEAATRVKVGVSISLALLDEELHAHPGAGHADAAGPARPGPADPRRRPVLRRAGRADPALPDRLRRPPRGAGRRARRGRGDQRQRHRPLSAARAPGSGSSPGCAATHPELVDRYQQLYARGAYVPKAYAEDLQRRLRAIQSTVRVTDARSART